MKKLSFFLMAMLFSVMSFAAEVTVKISDYATANGWNNSAQYKTLKMDDNVSITVTGGTNTGKYYTNGNNWRMYQNESPKITLTATNGNLLKTVKFTYTVDKSGILVDASKAQVKSGVVYTFADEVTTYTFGVSNTGTATNGQVRFTEITVVYDVPTPSNPDAVKYTVTAKVNDPAMGTVSGAGEYEEGKTATLTASANVGYKFVNWSTGSTANPLKINVTENVEVTANFEAIPPMTCAEAAATADGTTVVLKPFDVVAVVKGAGYTYIKDDSGVNLIFDYTMDGQFKAGDHVEGFVGVSSPYKGLPELKPSVAFADLTVTPGTAPEPTLFTEVPTKADLNKYVKFENVTLTDNATFTTESATNATMVVNGTNVTLRNAFKLAATLSKDKAYNLVGFVAVYNSTIQVYFLSIEEYVAPVVNHTVNVTATAEGEDIVTGADEYAAGEEVTVTASEDVEGWVFIGWTEDGEFVANDPEYTFVVEGDVELVAVYAMDLGTSTSTDLVIDGDNMLLTGSVADFQMGTMNLELALGEYNDEEGVYLLTEESKLYVGETNFTFVDGMAVVDMNTNSAMAIVVFELEEAYYYMMVDMSAAPAEPIEVNVTNATATVGNDGWLTLNGTWNELPVMAKVAGYDEEAEEKVYEASYVGEFEYGVWEETESDFGFADQVTVTKKGDVITLEATFTSLNSGNVYNVTITTGAKISTAVDNVEATVAPVKTIENGQLIVIKNGVKYNALGQEIK